MKLAINGDHIRGKEVIEILEMLGGKNTAKLKGISFIDYYSLDKNNNIVATTAAPGISNQYLLYSLEEFLEKFPYKVGDKVQLKKSTSCGSVFEVEKMRWIGWTGNVEYTIKRLWYNNCRVTATAENLQPYKEETMEEEGVYAYNEINCYHQDFGDKVKIRLGGDYEIKVEDKITYIVKKQSQYPKTYKECCEVLMGKTDFQDFELVLTKLSITQAQSSINIFPPSGPPHITLINNFYKLLICRDAYWQIAGKQMGLGKPWEPDSKNKVYYIFYCVSSDSIGLAAGNLYSTNAVFAFPTEEMRDEFYENNKNTLERCKKLLT